METLHHITFSQLFDDYLSNYLREFGERKAKQVADKVKDSNKCNRFLSAASKFNGRIGSDDIVSTVLSSSSFAFAKGETVCLASFLLLLKWNVEIGVPSNISDAPYLNDLFFRILNKCASFKSQISEHPNFFNKFHKSLITSYPISSTQKESKEEEGLILPGIGIDGIIIGKTTSKDIEARYGYAFSIINHNGFSTEIFYDYLGISFYFKNSDVSRTIFFIKVTREYSAHTKEGIILDWNTDISVADISTIYGRNKNFLSSEGSENAYLAYDGIMFYVDKYEAQTRPGEFVNINGIGIIGRK